MSRAYGFGALNAKYNTLLALTLAQGGGGGGSQDLQQVLDVGNVATNTSIISQSADTFFTTTITETGISTQDTTNGLSDYQTNSMNFASNNINNIKADGVFLYEEYSNVATKQTITLQHQDGFITPPTVPNPISKCEITTEKVEINNYNNNVATATSSLTADTLTVTKKGFLPDYQPEISVEPVAGINVTDGSTLGDKATTQITEGFIKLKKEFEGVEQDVATIDGQVIALSNSGVTLKTLVSMGHNGFNGEVNCYNVANDQYSQLTHSAFKMTSPTGDPFPSTNITHDIISVDSFGEQRYARLVNQGDEPYLQLTTPTNSVYLFSNGLNVGSNGYGTAGQVLTRTATGNEFEWADAGGGGGWVGTAESNLDMVTYDITSSTGTLNLNATNIEITGQANFVSPPHLPPPVQGIDGATKGYVDSLVGQYSGGFNLFLNYSQTSSFNPTYKVLSQTISSAVGQQVDIIFTSGTQEVARFISEPLGITELPTGLFDAFVYGSVSGQGGDVHYSFELNKVTSAGVSTPIVTSGISPDVNSSPNNNPTSYSMIAPITAPVALALTDRLAFILSVTKTNGGQVTLRTFFEGSYYSFVQSTLNAGTTLLTSNNNWTGTNNFAINPTTPSKTSPANTDIINYADIQRLSTPIVSTLEYYISTVSPFFQYPPAPPTAALINAYQYYGWYFINSVALRNVAWFFAPDYQMTVADVNGLYMNYFNITTTSNDNLPFITIYTKPTGVNDFFPGFAHSARTFAPTFSTSPASPYCSFMNISGTQQDPFPYGHILGGMVIANTRGEYLPTEEVLAIAVGTSTSSPVNQVNFIMSKVGICLEQGNQELILNPQNILEQPTLSTVLSLGSAAGNQSITGVNNLAATSVTTPTLANGANTLTIGTAGQITNVLGTLQNNGTALPAYISASGVASGAINMNANNITGCPSVDSASALTLGNTTATGTTLGRATQTTNLLGNVQFNSSSGTSGQVLTSTGATTAPTFQALPTPAFVSTATSNLNMSTFSITSCPSVDSASALALGNTTATGTTLGRATQTTNLLGNLQVNSQAGTSGQYLKSNGSGSVPTWANPALGVVAPAQGTPNAGITIPYQLFISTVINGTAGDWYLFTFRTNLTSASTSESPEIAITLTTSAGSVTPTTTNSFNVTTPGSNILTTRPDELTALCISKHYGAISGRQDQNMNFTYLYQFASTATITFGVWSWGNGTSGTFNRKNVSLNYVRLNA